MLPLKDQIALAKHNIGFFAGLEGGVMAHMDEIDIELLQVADAARRTLSKVCLIHECGKPAYGALIGAHGHYHQRCYDHLKASNEHMGL